MCCFYKSIRRRVLQSDGNLNLEQREFVMHILHCVKINQLPFHIFLSGAAGVGKSTVINAIYQSVNFYLGKVPGNNDGMKHVLLCAPSGKAAFSIEGVTLHTDLNYQFSKFSTNAKFRCRHCEYNKSRIISLETFNYW